LRLPSIHSLLGGSEVHKTGIEVVPLETDQGDERLPFPEIDLANLEG
jgi:hypothetical protein